MEGDGGHLAAFPKEVASDDVISRIVNSECPSSDEGVSCQRDKRKLLRSRSLSFRRKRRRLPDEETEDTINDLNSSGRKKNSEILDINENNTETIACDSKHVYDQAVLNIPVDNPESGASQTADNSPIEEEDSFLSLLFRRSTWRRKSRKPETPPAIGGTDPEAPPLPPRSGFRRNASFYHAQSNADVIQQVEQQQKHTPDAGVLQNRMIVAEPVTPTRTAVENPVSPEQTVPQQSHRTVEPSPSNGSQYRANILETLSTNTQRPNRPTTQPSRTGRTNNDRRGRRAAPRSSNRPGTGEQPLFARNLLVPMNRSAAPSASQASLISANSERSRQSSDTPTNALDNSQDLWDFSDDMSLHRFINESNEDRMKRVGFWPHAPCSMLAALACTLGISNICRFSFLCFQYGGGFILQFLMLTIAFGFPMVSFFMTIGQYMGCGLMDMWKISPVFQGVGIASLMATSLIGIYNIVPVSWMFIYFRDSFIPNGVIRWGPECSPPYKGATPVCNNAGNFSSYRSSVPDYFRLQVLRRSIDESSPQMQTFGELKFENVFNLAVVWMIVFICLSKGLKSYGKVVFAFAFFPLIGFLIVSVELLRQADAYTEYVMTKNTFMYEIFTSGASWVAAAREVFFTWGLHGAVLMQITSHNRLKHSIKRDSTIVIIVTLSSLLVAAFLTCSCFAIIYRIDKVEFVASSFETEKKKVFLVPNPVPYSPLRSHWSNNLLLGEEMVNSNTDQREHSNYQVYRLATELFPAAIAYLGVQNISPFWSILWYLTFISFGLAQQLAIWRCVIESIMAIKPQVLRAWETTITFVACVMGFVLGLPLVTEYGIYVIYFMDFCIGSAWWIMIIYLTQILAVFIVRGRPYSSDDIVTILATGNFMKKWLSPLISFSWSVIIPIGLLVLSITSFKTGGFGRIFSWYDQRVYRYWPTWARQIGTFLELTPLFLIPLTGIIQTCRYLYNGPADLFDRLQMLYRPSIRTPPDGQQTVFSDVTGHSDGIDNRGFTDDPPPKYTPPPSYSTATGLRFLKRLNSLRRSFRATTAELFSSTRPSDVEMVSQGATNSVSTVSALISNPPSSSLAPPILVVSNDAVENPSSNSPQNR